MIKNIGFIQLYVFLFFLLGGYSIPADSSFVKDKKPKTIASDSSKTVLFQELINEFCKINDKNGAILRICEELKTQIERDKKLLIAKKADLEATCHRNDSLKFYAKTDTIIILDDSLCNSEHVEKNKTGFLDSLIEKLEGGIIVLDVQINSKEKTIDSLSTLIRKTETDVQAIRKKIKNATAKIYDGLMLNYCGVKYLIYVANLDSDEIRMHLYKNKKKQNYFSLDAVKADLELKGLEAKMITNAGMFTPSNEPEGLYIEEGSQTNFELDTGKTQGDANFYLSPNGVFYIDSSNTAHISTTMDFLTGKKISTGHIRMATQSGPMLLINGSIHPKFTSGSSNEKIRSGVGIINEKKIVFAATVDPSNFYSFSMFFKNIFDCRDALFLDGHISQMYLKDINLHTEGSFGPILSVTKRKIK